MKHLALLIFVLFSASSSAQLVSVPISAKDKKNGIIKSYISKKDHASIHLYLYSSGQFRFEDYEHISYYISFGKWRKVDKTLELTSTFQKGNLPISVHYRKRVAADSLLKSVDVIKDHKGGNLPYTILYINDDSTGCVLGDSACGPEFNQIDSIKVRLENNVSSRWVKVNPLATDEILQINVDTPIDLTNYMILNEKFEIKGDTLKFIRN